MIHFAPTFVVELIGLYVVRRANVLELTLVATDPTLDSLVFCQTHSSRLILVSAVLGRRIDIEDTLSGSVSGV